MTEHSPTPPTSSSSTTTTPSAKRSPSSSRRRATSARAASGAQAALDLLGRRAPAGHQRHAHARPRRHVAPREDRGGAPRDRGDHAHGLRRHRGGGGLPAARGRSTTSSSRRGSPNLVRAVERALSRRRLELARQRYQRSLEQRSPREDRRAVGGASRDRDRLLQHPQRARRRARRPRARDQRPLPARRPLHPRDRAAGWGSGTPRSPTSPAARSCTTSARSESLTRSCSSRER